MLTIQTASDQEKWGRGLQVGARPERPRLWVRTARQWTGVGTGARSASRAGVGGCRQGWNRSSWKAGNGLTCRSRRRGSGSRPRLADPRPHGDPTPGKLQVWTRPVCAAGPSPLPAHRRSGVARGPGRSASCPPSSRPRTSISAGRRAGRARRSCRRLRPCRKPPPPPPASRPVSSAALPSANSGPVPPLPGSALPKRRRRASARPLPPPQPG